MWCDDCLFSQILLHHVTFPLPSMSSFTYYETQQICCVPQEIKMDKDKERGKAEIKNPSFLHVSNCDMSLRRLQSPTWPNSHDRNNPHCMCSPKVSQTNSSSEKQIRTQQQWQLAMVGVGYTFPHKHTNACMSSQCFSNEYKEIVKNLAIISHIHIN